MLNATFIYTKSKITKAEIHTKSRIMNTLFCTKSKIIEYKL